MASSGSMRRRKECNMCGNVGFMDELFLCSRCGVTWQHRYCSRLYTNLGHGNIVWECDWCTKAASEAETAASLSLMGITKKPPLMKKKKKLKMRKKQGHYALELLLLAVESMTEVEEQLPKEVKNSNSNSSSSCCQVRDEEGYGVVERQACSSKRTLASKRANGKDEEHQQHKENINNNIDESTMLVSGQRYKLLSDVLC